MLRVAFLLQIDHLLDGARGRAGWRAGSSTGRGAHMQHACNQSAGHMMSCNSLCERVVLRGVINNITKACEVQCGAASTLAPPLMSM